MINARQLLDVLIERRYFSYFGVPDSLLAPLTSEIGNNPNLTHIVAPNEGTAIAMAIGANLARNVTPVVYFQNSGLGNSLNPLVSLAHEQVYGIPILLIIGWRGTPGYRDEPQHQTQGSITLGMLELVGIKTCAVNQSSTIDEVSIFLQEQVSRASGPYALLISQHTFDLGSTSTSTHHQTELTREIAAIRIVESLPSDAIVITTTGKLSRELYEYRRRNNHGFPDFLTIGGMGHASAIALSVALEVPERTVVCLDGDGAFQMHMGASALIGECAPKNLIHVLVNNGVHESVGGSKIAAPECNYQKLAEAFSYSGYEMITSEKEISNQIKKICEIKGPYFVEVKVNQFSRSDLPRPHLTPNENKENFRRHVFGEFHSSDHALD